jgi:hypothetical protein
MLQVFYLDVVKIDRDVAHIAMAIHICFKCIFQMFDLYFSDVHCKCFHLDIGYVSHVFCKVFYLDVAYVLQ